VSCTRFPASHRILRITQRRHFSCCIRKCHSLYQSIELWQACDYKSIKSRARNCEIYWCNPGTPSLFTYDISSPLQLWPYSRIWWELQGLFSGFVTIEKVVNGHSFTLIRQMAALIRTCLSGGMHCHSASSLWSALYGIGQTIIYFHVVVCSSFFPRLTSAAADWISAILPHMVWP